MRTVSLALAAALAACQGGPSAGAPELVTTAAGSPSEAALNAVRLDLDPRGYTGSDRFSYVALTDEGLWRYEHRDEILETLEVVETEEMGDRAAVYLRYTVGPRVFRDGVMTRRVGDRWIKTFDHDTYFSSRVIEDSAVVFDKRLFEWREESPSVFPERPEPEERPVEPIRPLRF